MKRFKSPNIQIAFNHLLYKKRQTIVAMLGVTFGIAIFIFQAGLMSGFQSYFIEQTVSTTANIRLYNESDQDRPGIIDKLTDSTKTITFVMHQKPKDQLLRIKDGYQIAENIEKNPEVIGVSPSVSSQVIFRVGIAQFSGRVSGVDIVKENVLFDLTKNMREGNLFSLQTVPNGIILGSELARLLGAKMNDNIQVISPLGVSLDMKVVGIHHSGIVEADKSRAFINIRNAQKLLNVDGNYITDINIKLKDFNKAEVLAKEFQEKYKIKAMDWKQANANIFSVFKIQNMVTYLIIASILIVSGFGIFNILMMIIYEKMPDIAILKAIGYKDSDIRQIFLVESLIIGFIGGLLGLLLGFTLQKIIGNIRMDVKGFISLEYLRFNSSPLFYGFAFFFGLLVTAIAGYIPANKASKVDPIDIIRSK